MDVIVRKNAVQNYEYGCDLQRLYPWEGVTDPFWGSAMASVRPGEATTPHDHNEKETFIVLSGKGKLFIDDESHEMNFGDVAYIPENSHHWFENLSSEEPLVFLSIFWDSPESIERIRKTYIE